MAQIIPKIPLAVEPVAEKSWQKELSQAFTQPEALLDYLQLPRQDYAEHIKARKLFPMRVPRPFADRMTPADPNDPLLRQVFPLADEFMQKPGFSADPLLEQSNQQPGILHKYQSRALLIVKGGCAVNCRYCFRRHFPYQQNHLNKNDWQNALEHIRQHPQLDEIIYSGGDPLMAKDDFLAWLTSEIEQIPHIQRLRIHTRLPVVIPQRITQAMLGWFTQTRLNPVMVLHINHAQEIDQTLMQQVQRLRQAGVTLLNQAVLLKQVNDSADAQAALSQKLFDCGVLPYYLHMLDKVKGASHFDLEDKAARQIMAEMIKRLPGYLVPKLVREIGGQPGKTPVDLKLHP